MLFLKKSCPVKMHNGTTDKSRKGGDPWPEGLDKNNALNFAVSLDDDGKDCINRIAKWEKRTGRKISDLERALPDTEEFEESEDTGEASKDATPSVEDEDDEKSKKEIFKDLKALEDKAGRNLIFNMNDSKKKLKSQLETETSKQVLIDELNSLQKENDLNLEIDTSSSEDELKELLESVKSSLG